MSADDARFKKELDAQKARADALKYLQVNSCGLTKAESEAAFGKSLQKVQDNTLEVVCFIHA